MMLMPMSHQWQKCNVASPFDKKSHVAPCFNYPDLANKMVQLTMPSMSCDTHTGGGSII